MIDFKFRRRHSIPQGDRTSIARQARLQARGGITWRESVIETETEGLSLKGINGCDHTI
jgi:hypothetical protein